MSQQQKLKKLIEKSEQDILNEPDSKLRGSYGTTGAKKLFLIKGFFDNKSGKRSKILDIGGTDFTYKALKIIFPNSEITTLNIQKYHVRNCKKVILQNAENIKTRKKFDIVITMELFEHTKPDDFLKNIRKVLKDKGILVLSCPNFASWYSRIYLLFGHQPPNYDISDMYKLSPLSPDSPAGHKTSVTMKAMEKYLESFGFKIIYKAGYPYAEDVKKLSKLRKYLDYILPIDLKEGMLFIARKVRKPKKPSTYYEEWIKSKLIYS